MSFLPRQELPLAMFPDEHGWTGNGVGTYSDAGGGQIVNTDRSFKIETSGAGTASVASSPALTAVDLTGSHVSFHSQLSFSSRLKTLKLRLASGAIGTDYAEATIWNEEDDTIPLQSTFEKQSIPKERFAITGTVDWSKITRAQIVVTDDTSGKLTLYVAGIYAVPTSPRTIISFCFDDGYASVFTRALKKLSAVHYAASAYLIVDLLGGENRLTLAQVKALRDQHNWEIGGHAFTVEAHNKPSGLDDLEGAALEAEFDGLRDWLDEMGFRRVSFAYPKGAAGEEVRALAKRDYSAARATGKGPETIPTRDDYTIRGWSIAGLTDTVATIKAAIDQAVDEGSWLVLTFHNIVTGEPASDVEFRESKFGEIVDYIRALEVEGADLRVLPLGA